MIVLDVRKEARHVSKCKLSLTVGELVGFLSELDPNETVIVGSAFLSADEGWAWYSSIKEADFKDVSLNEVEDIGAIVDAW